MNPIFAPMIYDAVRKVARICSHCKRKSHLVPKQAGQFYKCPRCGHRFKEMGRPEAARSKTGRAKTGRERI